MNNYIIDQTFFGVYPPKAAVWCNRNNAYIKQVGAGEYVICAVSKPTKEKKVEARLAERLAYLVETDWYAVRYAETGVAIPEDVKAQRQAARDEIDALRLELIALEALHGDASHKIASVQAP